MPKMSEHLVSAPLNPITIVDHLRKSRSQCEHRYWQGIWVGKQPKGNVKAVQTLFNTSSLLYMPKPNISSYLIYTHMRESEFKKRPGLVAFPKILNWPYTLSNNAFWAFYLVFSDRQEPSCLRKFQPSFQFWGANGKNCLILNWKPLYI